VIMRRSLLAVGLLFGLGAVAPAIAAPAPGAFINDMGNKALAVLSPANSPQQRVVAFRALFRRDFNVPQIARFVLGPYWRAATPNQQREFIRLFTNYVALAYSSQLSQYSNERLVVTGSRPIPGGAIVTSQVARPGGGQPIAIGWRLTRYDNTYKVSDVVIDGISMAITQRSEFASVIQRNGGNLQALLAALRAKTAGIEGS
jgi:phospholipid transport system substrate-binding protein